MEDNRMICSHCGAIIEDEEQYESINGNPVCSDCVERYATYCDHCGADYETVRHGKICPHCGSGETWLLRGNEVEIAAIEVPEKPDD